MPVEPGATKRHHGVSVLGCIRGISGLLKQRQMSRHAVVVVEKAVANKHRALWIIRSERRHLRLGLALTATGPSRTPIVRTSAIVSFVGNMAMLPD
jgi:hypothetical protein